MKIFGEIELHTLDKQVVECQLVELSIIYDMYRAHYRVKSDDYNIVLFFDKYGQVTKDALTVNGEIDEVRRVIRAFIPQLDIEVARKIVRAIYKEMSC